MKHASQTLRGLITLLAVALLAGAAPGAWAKAAYVGEDEMIRQAEVIALVDISRVEQAETKGGQFDYREIAHATVRQTLKGALPQAVNLYGDETFICAQVRFAPGRYLVFLRRDGGLLVGCNWHLSVRPIKDAQVEWFVAGDGRELSWQPFDAVRARIEKSTLPPDVK
jgi:hypothetical protein